MSLPEALIHFDGGKVFVIIPPMTLLLLTLEEFCAALSRGQSWRAVPVRSEGEAALDYRGGRCDGRRDVPC